MVVCGSVRGGNEMSGIVAVGSIGQSIWLSHRSSRRNGRLRDFLYYEINIVLHVLNRGEHCIYLLILGMNVGAQG